MTADRREFLQAAAAQMAALGDPSTGKRQDEGPSRNSRFAQRTPRGPQQPFTISPGHVAEHPFSQYQLHGTPDEDANLLGKKRPRDWSATKELLSHELATTADETDPIHAWLRTFKEPLSNRAASIVMQAGASTHSVSKPNELRYEPQLYDGSLRGAAMLLDRCLKYRNQMGGFEGSGISSGLSYLTFLKLKPLQRNFLIQSNSADISHIEQRTEEYVSEKYREQISLFQHEEMLAKAAEASGAAASASLAGRKTELLTKLLEKQFHIQTDFQLAEFTRVLTPGSASNFAERYLRTLVMLSEDLTDAYCRLYSASRGLKQVLGLTQLNISGTRPIDILLPLFSSSSAVTNWVNQVVQTEPLGERKPDVLDALVLWSRAALRMIDERAQYESEFTISIPLTQPWGSSGTVHVPPAAITTAFGPTNPTGNVSFALATDALSLAASLQQVRVTGVGLSFQGSPDVNVPVQYASGFPTSNPNAFVRDFEIPRMLRVNAMVTTPPQTMEDGTVYSRPKLFLPNVQIQGGTSGDQQPTLSMDAPCRGLNPVGNWTLNIDKDAVAYFASATPIGETWIQGIVMHLRLRAFNA